MPSTSADPTALAGALEPAWHADGTPFSPEFGDVYYSRDSGLEESRHVFLAGNALPARWSALREGECFVIGETGFGTGLNFLLAWQAWQQSAPPGTRLLFRSLEARPLSHAALRRALGCWSALATQASALLGAWPPALPGLHAMSFDAGRVTLQLFIGDVDAALDEFRAACEDGAVDAWFLDGFAPARNPRMWSDAVLARIGALTRPGGTAATFSAAAAVRHGLAQAGFTVRKTPGFGRKRDMLRAERTGGSVSAAVPALTPWHRAVPSVGGPREAIVVGAGIAGATTARALAQRGWTVTVLDAAAGVAAGASGNPQAILFAQLPAGDSAHGEFTLASYLHALRCHAELLGEDPGLREACGLLHLHGEAEQERLGRLAHRYAALPDLARALDRGQASALAGIPLAAGGMLLPASGWIDPRAACHMALATAGVTVVCGQRIERLSRAGAGWRLDSEAGEAWHAPVVVLANARGAGALLPHSILPLQPVRGQVTLMPLTALPAAPRCVVCADGYLIPPRDGTLCCGASFVPDALADAPSEREQHENLARVAAITPAFDARAAALLALEARVAERCATPDRLPVAGRVPDAGAFSAVYADLRANARRVIATRAPCLPGLFVNVGHGSRGMCSAPLTAELIAAELAGEPLPVTQRVARALSPARFLLRTIVRGESA